MSSDDDTKLEATRKAHSCPASAERSLTDFQIDLDRIRGIMIYSEIVTVNR